MSKYTPPATFQTSTEVVLHLLAEWAAQTADIDHQIASQTGATGEQNVRAYVSRRLHPDNTSSGIDEVLRWFLDTVDWGILAAPDPWAALAESKRQGY
jgi:hypothetical protein